MKMEVEGIEPRACRMLSERYTTELHSRCVVSLIPKTNPNLGRL